jgi:anti-sigma B factor antagonist
MTSSSQRATYDVRNAAPGIAVIEIDGDLNASASDKLAEAYQRASTPGTKAVVLSFRGLHYMNSSGIGLLVTLLIRARRNGQRVIASDLSEHYCQIFNVTRLEEAIQIFDTEAEAVDSAREA